MDIVIVSEFCEDFSNADNDRFFYLAKMLAEENQVEIITSSFRHTTKSCRREPTEQAGVKITYIEEPGYPKNVCLERFRSHYIWGENVEEYLKSRRKPEVIYCAVPSLSGPNLIAKYCEREKIRFVIDIQDLWPEAFQMVFNVPVIKNIAFAPFKACANGIYKRADAICAVSDSYCERAKMVNKKVKDTTTVFLGTELSTFDKYASKGSVLKKEEGELWLSYTGTLGTSYDLPLVFEAMRLIRNPKLRFIIMGDGPLMRSFLEQSKDINVTFTGRLDYDQMCGVLASSDIVVNPIIGTSVASIINKHADYAASGLPVVNTQKSPEYRDLVDRYEMGINSADDPAEVAKSIEILIEDVNLRLKAGAGARKCAKECFDREHTYQKLIEVITTSK